MKSFASSPQTSVARFIAMIGMYMLSPFCTLGKHLTKSQCSMTSELTLRVYGSPHSDPCTPSQQVLWHPQQLVAWSQAPVGIPAKSPLRRSLSRVAYLDLPSGVRHRVLRFGAPGVAYLEPLGVLTVHIVPKLLSCWWFHVLQPGRSRSLYV